MRSLHKDIWDRKVSYYVLKNKFLTTSHEWKQVIFLETGNVKYLKQIC